MRTIQSIEGGLQLRIQVAALLKSGVVLTTSGVVEMAKQANISVSTASNIVRTVTNQKFTELTGVKPEKIHLGHGTDIIFDPCAEFHTNMREKLQSMLTNEDGNSVKSWRRNKIVKAASAQGLQLD